MPQTIEGNIKIPSSSRIIIAGSSNSGKTHLCFRLLNYSASVFEKPFDHIYWFYLCWQDFYSTIKDKLVHIDFCEGLTKLEPIISDVKKFKEKRIFLVFDDLQEDAYSSELVSKIFCAYAHHLPIEQTILITQNPLLRTKYQPTISRNANIMIFLKSSRLKSAMNYIGSQIFPGKGKILSQVYEKEMETSTEKFPYLVCNFDCDDDRFQFQSGLIPGQQRTLILSNFL